VSSIDDQDGNPLSFVDVAVANGLDTPATRVHVPCTASRKLKADDSPVARVLARRAGDAGPFTDIATSPIDLTPWAGTSQWFDLVFRGATDGSAVIYVRVDF
jgi:hypothetical protein